MNAPVTRRALLGATAAVGAVGLPRAAVAETTILASDLNAELFALLDRWRDARAALDASWEAFEAASDRERDARPPQPDALSWRPDDFPRTSYGRGASDAVGDTGHREYGVRGVEWLRRVRPVAQWSETAEARRQEIVWAYDGWTQARKAVEDATGYTAADEAVQAGIETLNAAEEAAKLCEPPHARRTREESRVGGRLAGQGRRRRRPRRGVRAPGRGFQRGGDVIGALSLRQHGPQLRLPALDQVGPGQERSVQGVQRHGHYLAVGGVRDHDLHLGVRVETVHGEGHGEQVVDDVLVLWVSLDPLHLRHADVPVHEGQLIPVGRFSHCRLGCCRLDLHVLALRPLGHAALLPVLAAASQDSRRRRARAGGKRTTAGGGASDAVAAEARDIVRRAVGDAAGLTIKAQVRQAARNLGFPAESWRPREAFYGRAGAWSAAALDDLRRRYAMWRAREAAPPSNLAQRVGEVRRLLTELEREVAGLEAEIAAGNWTGQS